MQNLLPVILLLLLYATAPHAGETTDSPVVRAMFTTAIQQAEPVDCLSVLHGDREQVFLFMELRDMTGEAVMLTWEHKGSVVARVRFHIEQANAHLWSGMLLTPDMQGTWRVVITNASGTILAEKTLDYNPDGLPF